MDNKKSGSEVLDIILTVLKAVFFVVFGFLWVLFVFIGVDKNKD